MDILYGIILDFNDMETILKKVYNNDMFYININIIDYKQYEKDLNNYIENNFNNNCLKLFSTVFTESKNNIFWTIGYFIKNIGYCAFYSAPKISKMTKLIIKRDYICLCKHFNIKKNNYCFCNYFNINNNFKFIIKTNDYELYTLLFK